MSTRRRQPYKQKQVSKSGALLFGCGLGAMLATLAIGVAFAIPGISRRLENIPYYARTYTRKLVPHPEYLPTPAPTVSFFAGPAAPANGEGSLNLPPVPTSTPDTANRPTNTTSDQIIPAAITTAPLANMPAEAGEEDFTEIASPVLASSLKTAGEIMQLSGITHQWQTWNNCGPATITMNMSYFGRPETQVEAAQFLKPNKDDKNVNPHELAAYARTVGLKATVRQGGSIEQLKQFLSNGVPVLAETWLVHDGDGLGHYRLLTGYNDAAGQFTTFDSLNGANFTVNYKQFDTDWRVFNRLYLVIYSTEQAKIVHSIIGEELNDTVMYHRLATEAQAEIEANPGDAIAYFNQGDALTRLGRYQDAAASFDQARTLGLHWRRLWYQFTPFEAYYAIGRYQDVLDLTTATIAGTGGLEEAYYYQGLALHATGQSGSKEAFEAAMAYNPNFISAKEALNTVTK